MLNHQAKINQINGSAMINQNTDYLNFDDHKLLTRGLPLEQKINIAQLVINKL